MAAPLYCFGIKVPEFPGRVVISTREIVGNVVRDRDLVARKEKSQSIWPGVFGGDLLASSQGSFPRSSARGKEPGYDEASDLRENLCSQNSPLYGILFNFNQFQFYYLSDTH